MEGLEFLEFVWERQGEGHAAIAVKEHEDHWDESFFEFPSQVEDVDLRSGAFATYFCPNLFDRRRKKERCLPGRWLWQDLDEVDPNTCDPEPTLWWETSPSRYQGLWLLDEHVEPQELSRLNKQLNRHLGADKGTWNLTRLLRVPGSYNGKRDATVSPAHLLVTV